MCAASGGLVALMASAAEKPHTERWAYRKLYTANIFQFTTGLYPFLRRPGFQAVARTVAWFYAVTQPAIRQVVRKNLTLLRKEPVSDAEAIRVFVNYGATIADYVAAGAMSREDVLALCTKHIGQEHLAEATRGGRGVILATAHYGFFEFGAVVLGGEGYKVTIATLPEPSDPLTEWRANWRARWGTQTVPVGADPFSSLHIVRALEAGRCTAMLADRPIGERGFPVDLPNGRTHFSISPALLSWMTGCKILPALISRRPGGRYHINTLPAIEARRGAGRSRQEEIERCTRELAGVLFGEIRRDPLQWYQFVPVGV